MKKVRNESWKELLESKKESYKQFPCLEKQGGGKPKQIFNPFGPDNPHINVGVFYL